MSMRWHFTKGAGRRAAMPGCPRGSATRSASTCAFFSPWLAGRSHSGIGSLGGTSTGRRASAGRVSWSIKKSTIQTAVLLSLTGVICEWLTARMACSLLDSTILTCCCIRVWVWRVDGVFFGFPRRLAHCFDFGLIVSTCLHDLMAHSFNFWLIVCIWVLSNGELMAYSFDVLGDLTTHRFDVRLIVSTLLRTM